MATVDILGTVVGVFRECEKCNVVKSLEHYFIYGGSVPSGAGNGPGHGAAILGRHKVCAACRARRAHNVSEYDRTIGAADWGESK